MARGKDQRDRQRQPNIPPLVPALIAVIVAGVMVLVVAGTIGDDEQPVAASTTTTTTTTIPTFDPPSTTTTTLPDPVPVASVLAPGLDVDAPTSYEITYDIVEHTLAREETWVIVRPYLSLVTSTRDGALLSGTATSQRALRTYLSDREGWLTIQPELHRASFDQRPAGSLGTLEQMGLVEHVGNDEVLGRSCARYRTGAPTSSATKAPPTDAEHVDFCVDEAGLILREVWSRDGETITERTATSLEIGVDPDPSVFAGGETIADEAEFAEAFQNIAVPADQETIDNLRTVLEPPAGYELDGTVFRASVGQSGSPSSTEVVRFYSSGPDLLEVIERFYPGAASLSGPGSTRVDVDGWDEVWLEADFRYAVIRVRLDEQSVVELRHHDPAFLFDVLAGLDRK